MIIVGLDEAQLILRLIDAVSRVVAAVIGSGSGAWFAFWLMRRFQANSDTKRSIEDEAEKEEFEAKHLIVAEQVEELEEKIEKIHKHHKKKKRKDKCKTTIEPRRHK